MLFSAWPASGDWSTMLKEWEHLASQGWSGLWSMDHFMTTTDSHNNPVTESMTALAALGSIVPDLKIGTMVAGNTYRHPAILAKMAINIDLITKGRFILGIGCGWQEIEHRSFGINFPNVSERVRMLDESASILSQLLKGEVVNFSGKYYEIDNVKLNPGSIQNPIPLLIGGGGEQVTLKTVAKYADAWNIWANPKLFEKKSNVLEKHCDAVGRDSAKIHKTVAVNILFSDDKNFVNQESKNSWSLIGGNEDEITQKIGDFQDLGVDEIIVASYDKSTYQSIGMEEMNHFSESIIKFFNG
jgi:alkanesulfonate monooxygenase SsuD/methylene tetrahydromethanopterin reductase-like flavin-dependent oxidoreductase (luciferase family)